MYSATPPNRKSAAAAADDAAAVKAKLVADLQSAVREPATYSKPSRPMAPPPTAAAAAAAPPATTATPTPLADAATSAKEAAKRAATRQRYVDSWAYRLINAFSPWLLIAALLLMLAWARHATDPLSHLVGYQAIVTDVRVLDGNRFRARVYPESTDATFTLRLVDAPELNQPHGRESAIVLRDILFGGASAAEDEDQCEREVTISIAGRDEAGGGGGGGGGPGSGAGYYVDAAVRDSIFLNTSSVALALVERGAAWAHRGFHSAQRPSPLVLAMERAREARRGLWAPAADGSTAPKEPWVHRKEMKAAAAAKAAPTEGAGQRGGGAKKRKSDA